MGALTPSSGARTRCALNKIFHEHFRFVPPSCVGTHNRQRTDSCRLGLAGRSGITFPPASAYRANGRPMVAKRSESSSLA
eukprot:scaffold1307_cov200-Pinguiococcus_pyrenoidosus.AAC.34